MIAVLLLSLWSFQAPDIGPAPDSYTCDAWARRGGEGWCDDESGNGRYSCPAMGLPEPVVCGIVADPNGSCFWASTSFEPAVGELEVIWIRSMLNGIASPVCMGGPECEVELVEENSPCD